MKVKKIAAAVVVWLPCMIFMGVAVMKYCGLM